MNKNEQLREMGQRRNRWLSGGSVLAAAAASLTLFSGPAFAQSRMPVVSIAPAAATAAPSVRRLPQVPVLRDAATASPRQQIPAISIAAGAYAEAAGMNLSAPSLPAPQTPTPVPTGTAPVGGSVSIISAPAAPTITTMSTTVAPSNGDTNTTGINVAASANYFSSEAIFTPGTIVDVVDVLGASAIINWTTNNPGTAGGEVTFLGAGRRLNFVSTGGNFTVLNRIFTPTVDAAVRIDGSVSGRTDSGDLIGGNIWFYSPGGLIIGANATFNVGSLVLTSSNLNAIGSTINFTGVAETNTAVVIESGAQISALEQNSYFAVVAPRVVQGGSVDVNGSVAYVGAEQAQLTINNGLFDISVGVGSADANGVVHTGTTTGAASVPLVDGFDQITDADARGIYMVAVPKNTAISMLVGGTVGYRPAEVAARADNGSIILSAGAGTVAGGTAAAPTGQVDTANAVSGGEVILENVTFTSNAEVYASDSVSAIVSGTNAISSGSDGRGGYDLVLKAANSVSLSLQDSGSINVDGNLILDASAAGADDFATFRNNGGTGIGEDAVAGSISFDMSGSSTLNVGGSLFLNASAQGGKGQNQNGSSTAGDISANFNSTGTATIGGFIGIDARARAAQEGKDTDGGPGLIGNSSVAGDVTLNFGGASVIAGGLDIDTTADATRGDEIGGPQNNDAAAGDISVNLTSGFNQFGFMNLTSQSNSATSLDVLGNSFDGAAGRGSVSLSATNFDTVLNVLGNASIDVSTDGAIAPPIGDTVSIIVNNVGTSGGMFVGGDLRITTIAGGGLDSGVTTAGSVLLDVTDGQLFVDFLDISAFASVGGRTFSSGGTGRNFQAGDVTLLANSGGRIQAGFATIINDATGNGDTGGDAIGGTIALTADNGGIAFTNGAVLIASANGGAGIGPDGQPAIALGGDILVTVTGISGSLALGSFSAQANAQILFDVEFGTPPFVGAGGTATAGSVTFNIDGGTLTAGDLTISATGTGGVGGGLAPPAARSTGLPSSGDGGLGQGGDVVVNLNGGNAIVDDLTVSADGIGGDGASGDFEDGTRGGRGGDAVGGTVTFNALSGTLDAGSMIISAQANSSSFGGGSGGGGSASEGGDGGNATGGSATFNLNGSATITSGAVLVTTDGNGGRGGSSFATFDGSVTLPGQDAGRGGDGTGGTTTFNNVSGDISFTDLTASAQGIGGDGGDSFGLSFGDSTGAGGAGGDGIGGIATINLDQDDGSDPVYIVNADAAGGDGGLGQFSGNGGAASGGTANLVINNSDVTLDAATMTASAVGGNAGFADTPGGTAGSGGNAVGGAANLEISGALANVSSSVPLTISANAAGGDGAEGAFAAAGANGSDGGAGGSGLGGTARIGVSGAGASLTIDSQLAILSAEATGGQGGNAGNSFDANGGTGGQGGDAIGGSLTLEANSGTTLTIDEVSGAYGLFSNGTAGAGGQGGDGGFATGSLPGNGGDGGTGVGGSPTLRAIGGTIDGTNVVLAAIGNGGDGGVAGAVPNGPIGEAGIGGGGQGGNPVIELLDGSPGIITFGDVAILTGGTGGAGSIGGATIAGRIDIRDLSSDPGGVFTFNSLVVVGLGDIALADSGFFVSGGSGTNTIVGDQTINVVGDISYVFDGDGQLVVGGATNLTATGNVLVTHTNNTGLIASLDSGGDFTANAGLDFIADEQSIIGSDGAIAVRAEGVAQANDLQAFSNINFSAGQNAMVNNASVFGPAVTIVLGAGTLVANGITIEAGGDNNSSIELFDPLYAATITGDVTSTGFVSVTAGGNAVFEGGSRTISDNGLTVRTGDDIIIVSGALVEAGANAATSPNTALPFSDFNNLLLDAGALARSGELFTTPLTPLASIVSAGTINANDFAVILNANAIDGLGGTINASSMAADIVDAPNAGLPQGNDDMLLSGQCLQGNICLGSISTNNRIEIGQNSNNDVIQLIVEQATITADDVLITIREDIVMGSDGIPTMIDAANTFAIESLTGDINLIDAVINSDQITVTAFGSLLGSGSLISANDIGITVGQDLNALLIDTGGELTDVVDVGGGFEFEYFVPGSIDIGTYNQGAAALLRVVTGGNNSFGEINLVGLRDITLIAGDAGPGDVFLGTATGGNTIDLTGDNVGYGDLAAAQFARFTANNGIVSGGSLSSGSLMTLLGDEINVGDLDAGFILTIDASTGNVITGAIAGSTTVVITSAGDITTGDLAASGLGAGLTADGNIAVGTVTTTGGLARVDLSAGGNVDYTAITGSQLIDIDGGVITGGDITGAAQVDLLGLSIAVGDITANIGFALLESTAGDIVAGDVTSTNFGVGIISAGGATLGNLSGSSVVLTTADDAQVGDGDAAGSLTFTIGGALVAGNLTSLAVSPGMRVTTGGNADIASASANALLDLNIGGALTGGNFTGGSLTTIDAQSVAIASAVSTAQSLTINATGGDAAIGSVRSQFGTTVTASGAAVIGAADSGTFTTINGTSVTLDSGTVGSNLRLNATAGDIAGTGTITVGGLIDLDATGAASFGSLDAAGGNFTVDAGGDITFDAASSSADIIMTTSAAIAGGDLSAGGSLSLDGGSIAIGNGSATDIDLISSSDILFDSLSSPNAISLSAFNGLIGGNNGAGDIDSDDDVDLVAQEIDLGNVTSGGSVSADASAGDANFGTVDAANDITISASGSPSLTNAISGGNTSVTGSSVAFANGTIGGDLSLTATSGDIDGNGNVTVGGGIALDSAGDISFGSLDAAGGNFTADAGGDINFTNANASGALGFAAGGSIAAAGAITAGEISLDSGDTVSAASVTAGSGIDIDGTNGVTLGALMGGSARLQATAGAVTVTNDIDLTGLLEAEGRSVFLRSSNALTVRSVASAGTIDIVVAGDLDLRGLNATGDIDLTSTGGSIVVNEAVASTITALPPGAQGPLQITSSGGNVDITAANDFTVNADVSAANALTINLGGLFDLQAGASGATIDALVGDLNIGTSGSLGRSDLTSSINITTGGDILLGGVGGGSPTTGLLVIDNDEFSRIFSGGDLSFIAQLGAVGGGNITVDTLDVLVAAGTGTPQDGNVGTAGGLFLEASAAIDVIGVATMTNAGTDNLFALEAAEAIRVNTESGALLVQDDSGGLAGSLDLAAPRIEAISSLARTDIAGAAIADIDSRLGQNDGAINDTGYFAAGDLSFTIDDALLIQNSGDGTELNDRRGFTANTVTIDSAGSTTIIVINGIVDSLTGVDAIAALGLPSIFDPGSTVNGCLILDIASCAAIPDVTGNPGLENPVQDLIDRDIDPSDDDTPGVGLDFSGMLVEMRKPSSTREDPLLDDPVTGAGNEDLWVTELDCDGVDADDAACEAGGALEPAE